jgi:hypothetical protein
VLPWSWATIGEVLASMTAAPSQLAHTTIWQGRPHSMQRNHNQFV